MKKELRCIHRHTFDEHPSCFYNGLVKTDKLWFIEQGLKVGYLDIETTNLKADIGFMISWCVKERGGEVFHDIITKDEIFNLEFDKRIVKSLLDTLDNFDILVTYNGTYFDIPFINTRALLYGSDTVTSYKTNVIAKDTKNGTKFVEKVMPKFFHWDLYFTVKSKLRLRYNSLKVVTQFLGINGKTDIDVSVWQKAQYGDQKSLREVLFHNKGDVVILERLHNRLIEFNKWAKKGA